MPFYYRKRKKYKRESTRDFPRDNEDFLRAQFYEALENDPEWRYDEEQNCFIYVGGEEDGTFRKV